MKGTEEKIVIQMDALSGTETEPKRIATIRKEFNSDVIPPCGSKIEDPVWKEEREVIGLTFDFAERRCIVQVEADESFSEEKLAEVKDGYESCGWTITSKYLSDVWPVQLPTRASTHTFHLSALDPTALAGW